MTSGPIENSPRCLSCNFMENLRWAMMPFMLTTSAMLAPGISVSSSTSTHAVGGAPFVSIVTVSVIVSPTLASVAGRSTFAYVRSVLHHDQTKEMATTISSEAANLYAMSKPVAIPDA